MAALLGYARVSTGEQELALQHDALSAAGGVGVFSDTASGALDDRVELARLLDHVREGDTLVVWRLDRPGRLRIVRWGSGRCRRDRQHDARRSPRLPRLRRARGVRARPDP